MQQEKLLAEGISSEVPKGHTFIILGEKYTPAQAVKVLEERVAALGEASVAHEAWRKKVAAADAKIAATKAFVAALRQAILVMFGTDPDILVKMALEARKAAVTRTLADRTAAANKAKATRAARHTMGPREKRLVTGESVDATPAPVTAAPPQAVTTPAAPAASPAPSPTVPAPGPVLNGANGATPLTAARRST